MAYKALTLTLQKMKTIFSLIIVTLALPSIVCAKGGHGHGSGKSSGLFGFSWGSHSSNSDVSNSPGTGSKSSSEKVSGYTAKSGKQVESYNRSTPDENFNNNFSTKGNVNPTTGAKGTRTTPEKGGELLMQR